MMVNVSVDQGSEAVLAISARLISGATQMWSVNVRSSQKQLSISSDLI